MARIGIAARLTLIIVGGLILFQLFTVTTYFIERRHAAEGATFAPLLGQIAALVQLLDHVPVEDRALVLRATTGINFLPSILESVPPDNTPASDLRLANWRLHRLLGNDDTRYISISLAKKETGENHVDRLRDYIGSSLRALIELKSGGYLQIQATGDLALRLLGIPVGLVAGILSFLVAVVALLAVRRETKPLSDLGDAVERFGSSLKPQAVSERGAPDVRALIGAVNSMQHRIVQLMRSRTIVLGAISHDLRTYLTRLRLRLELLPDSPQRSKASADLDGMQALVDDTLAFVRASFANGADDTADLSQIVTNEYITRTSLDEHVSLTGAEEPLYVRGSPTALARVVSNLAANAIAYGKVADLTLKRREKSVELIVEDRGPGIAASDRTQVFEPFVRMEISRSRDHGGAGLGLTIVRQIVESYGGTITIEDRSGGGARIRVTFSIPERSGATNEKAEVRGEDS
jgi:two-component system, OmpR family, osmolarity sensor histidine kinase EnvZ